MSMWEIETLMENTIRLIDKSNFTSSKKRNLIWNTYNLQNQFDCSFTHFRLMDVLIKNQYIQQYNVNEFPMSSEYPDFFNKLSNKDFEWIRENPIEEWSENNPEIAYWNKKTNKIYVDFGSKHYTNYSNEVVSKFEPLDFGIHIINESSLQKDKSIAYNWTAFLIIYVMEWIPTEKSLDKLKEDYFFKIKTILQQFDYTDYEVLHRGLDLKSNINEDWVSETQKELMKFVLK